MAIALGVGRVGAARWERRVAVLGVLARAALVSTALGLVAACGTLAGPVWRAPSTQAVLAFDEARALERAALLDPALDVDERIAEALARAVEADPHWVVPRRQLDSRAIADLAGPARLAERRAALATDGVTAEELYLAGRLEGAAGAVRFPQAIALAPAFPWPHHALSVDRETSGDRRGALAPARRAFERATCAFERALFGRRYAGLLADTDQLDRARAALEAVLAAGGLDAHAAVEVEVDLARLELDARNPPPIVERGYRRALALVASGRTSREETAALVIETTSGRRGRSDEAWLLDLEGALRRHPALADSGAYRDALARQDLAGIVAPLRRPAELDPWARLAEGFARGDERAALEEWLAAQPNTVLADDGLPLDARLRALVEVARRGDGRGPQARLELLEAALAAGLFDEAASLARRIDRAEDPQLVERARLAERRALAARALLGEIEQLLAAVMGEDIAWDLAVPQTALPALVEPDLDLPGVLLRIGALVERYAGLLGWDERDLAARVAASPVLRFGPFGAVLVPGPTLAARDAELGLGRAGDPVPGLAEVFDRLGRMGLFGAPPFGSVDGTVLRRLAAVERSGEHLGTPWNGMVVYCDGVDAHGRRSRSGLAISGAALHEGYWIDVGTERRRLALWRAAARVLEERGVEWLAATRSEFALACDVGAGGRLDFERARLVPPLGAAELLRLVVVAERTRPDGGDAVTLDDLIEVVSVHEEGHLCDRTRFLPLGRDPLGMLALAASEGFSPLGIERRLEYRAELVALACVGDPRLVLVELLEAAEVDTRIETVHAHAYREILADLLAEWNRALQAAPDPRVRLDHYLLHQVHLLGPEEVRALALRLARREGLVHGD
jgi:hypothetical protein